MTRLLEKAISEVSRLPKRDQDAVARWLMEELSSEERWARAFSASPGALANLAQEALAEHRRGKTRRLHASRR